MKKRFFVCVIILLVCSFILPSHALANNTDKEQWLCPVAEPCDWADPFGCKCSIHQGSHNGVDIHSPDKLVRATKSGVVIRADNICKGSHLKGECKCKKPGNTIIIDHKNGYYSYYIHSSEVYVKVGDTVLQGQTISKMGSTGKSTGRHLHFAIKKGKSYINPENFTYIHGDFSKVSAPAKPTNVSVSAIEYNSVKIKWKAVPDAQWYEISRIQNSTGQSKVITTKNTSINDTNLYCGKFYSYKIRAFRKIDQKVYGDQKINIYGNYSSVLKVTPVPSAPKSLTGSKSTFARKLKWSSVPGATGYEVYRSKSKSSGYKLNKTTASTSYSDTYLVRINKYYYKVRAYKMVNGSKVFGGYSPVLRI